MDCNRLTLLAHHLSTLAGMKMEDITPVALILSPDSDRRIEVAVQLRDEARSISVLLESAVYLLTRADELRLKDRID